MTRTYYAPAKINLWLRVFAPDASGYHPLDTLFCAVDLRDQLEISDAPALRLDVSGADVGPIEENLVYRAAQLYFDRIGKTPDVHVQLHKNIPAGAGLGGGSSDAAALLLALQDRNDWMLPAAELNALAAELGSDIPFFLCGSSWARAHGRGEILEPLEPLPERIALIVLPNFPIPTRDAYRWLDESGMLAAPDDMLNAPADWNDVDRKSTNTFELVLLDKFPMLRRVRDFLRENGARAAGVSGSGSAVYGLFDDVGAAAATRGVLALDPTLRIFSTHTLGG
jgi:4-diphosphocytidyl-2-C-methyl-D-erythritol kinase